MMSVACYREEHGPSGALDNINNQCESMRWLEADAKQRPLIVVSSVWFFAHGFIQIVGLARVLVRL
jgi:hypothetical protein